MDIRLEFGKRVRELRARSGISQELLADRAGLDRTYISGIERGERNIRGSTSEADTTRKVNHTQTLR